MVTTVPCSLSPSRHTWNTCPYCCFNRNSQCPHLCVHSILTTICLYTGLCMSRVLGVTYYKIPLILGQSLMFCKPKSSSVKFKIVVAPAAWCIYPPPAMETRGCCEETFSRCPKISLNMEPLGSTRVHSLLLWLQAPTGCAWPCLCQGL